MIKRLFITIYFLLSTFYFLLPIYFLKINEETQLFMVEVQIMLDLIMTQASQQLDIIFLLLR